MTSQAPSRCIDQRHSCCSKTWLICILLSPASPLLSPSIFTPPQSVSCLFVVPVYLLFSLTFNFLLLFSSPPSHLELQLWLRCNNTAPPLRMIVILESTCSVWIICIMKHRLMWCSFSLGFFFFLSFTSFLFSVQLFISPHLSCSSLATNRLSFIFPSSSFPSLHPGPHTDIQQLGSWSFWLGGRG